MRYLEIINELRRNPKVNVKKSPNEILKSYWEKSTDRVGYPVTVKDLFVTFTELDKLGINPQSKYNTPLGIYAYNISMVVRAAGDTRSMSRAVPFAGEHPYINLFKYKGEGYVLIIDKMRMDNTTIYFYEELRKIMSPFEKGEMRGGYMHYDDPVGQFIKEAEDEQKALVDTPGGHFWYVTWKCADVLSQNKKIAKPVAWNWLFRKLGIDAVVDTGAGIIHQNEPEQAVFFNTADIELIERISNKYNPISQKHRIEYGEREQQVYKEKFKEFQQILNTGDLEKIIDWYDKASNKKYLKFLPKELRIKVLKRRPSYISYLKSPTKDEKMAAVSANPFMLTYDPSNSIKLSIPEIIQAINNYADIQKFPSSYWEVKRLYIWLDNKDTNLLMALLRLNVGIISEIKKYLNLTPELVQYINQLATKQGISKVFLMDLTNN